jgi:hypothetical protein
VKPKYETEKVRIPTWRRAIYIFGGSLIALVGVAFVIVSLGASKSGSGGYSDLTGALVVSALGLIALMYGIRRPHELQLTHAARAAKAVADAAAEARANASTSMALKVLVPIGLLAFMAYVTSPVLNALRGRIAVYTIACDDWSTEAVPKCEGRWHADDVITYVVSTNQQFVVGVTDAPAGPERLSGCAVADRENWSCAAWRGAESPRLIMRDGVIRYDEPLRARRQDVRFVSRLDWWLCKLGLSKG